MRLDSNQGRMMNVKTVGLAALGILAVIVTGLLVVVFLIFPRVSAAPDMQVERTAERVARGDYLFNHALACVGCHTPVLEPRRFSGLPDTHQMAAGRYMGGPAEGFPADIYPPNLTPTALGDWTDGEIYRAIVSGVTRDGRPMFALMPYVFYKALDTEDAKALVAYLRSLPPQPVTQPATTLPLPVRIAMRFVVADPAPEGLSAPRNELAQGKYLAFAGACFECHTKRNDRGEPVGAPFAGGNIFALPGGAIVRSANITPDEETGIGGWSKESFIARFRSRTAASLNDVLPQPGDMDSEMPWSAYAGMTEADLGALYTYLRTVSPVAAEVVTFEPPPAK